MVCFAAKDIRSCASLILSGNSLIFLDIELQPLASVGFMWSLLLLRLRFWGSVRSGVACDNHKYVHKAELFSILMRTVFLENIGKKFCDLSPCIVHNSL